MEDNLQLMIEIVGELYRSVQGVRVLVTPTARWYGNKDAFRGKSGTVVGLSALQSDPDMTLVVQMDENFWPTNPVNIPADHLTPLEGQ